MHDVSSLIGLVVLFLCVNGYFLLIRHRLNVKMEFAPILTVAAGIILLMAAGAVMKLKWGALLFAVCGIGALIYELFTIIKNKTPLKTIFDKRTITVYVLFFVIAIYYMLYYKGHYMIGYDTFTHWGPAVKIMLHCDRFPAQWDALTWHTSYPAGAQAFEYLICRITNNWSDGMMLFGQTMIFISCIFAFAGVCRNAIVLLPIAIASCVWLRDIVYYLSVDTMLSFVCAAGFAMILCYRDEMKTRWWMVAPIIAILPVIKDAGFYHFAALLIWFSVFYFKNNEFTKKQKAVRYIIFIAALFIPFICWRGYLHFVTPYSLLQRHSFSLEYMQYVSSMKGSENTAQQAKEFWNALTDLNEMGYTIRIIAVSILIGILSVFSSEKGKRKTPVWFIVFTVLSFILYNVFLLGMYLFEMPESTLGSFYRYQNINSSMVFLMSTVLFASGIRNIRQMKTQAIPVVLTCGLLLWYSWGGLKTEPLKYPINDELQQKTIVTMMQEHPDQRPAVYTGDSNAKWQRTVAMANYYYYDEKEYALITTQPDGEGQYTLDEWKEYADYLVILEKDSAYTQYCEENGYDSEDIIFYAK